MAVSYPAYLYGGGECATSQTCYLINGKEFPGVGVVAFGDVQMSEECHGKKPKKKPAPKKPEAELKAEAEKKPKAVDGL